MLPNLADRGRDDWPGAAFSALAAMAFCLCVSADGRERPPPSHAQAAVLANADSSARAAPPARDDPRVTLGRMLFFDESLSVPEGTSCASCHDPKQGYAGNHGSTSGVAQGSRPGHHARRNTPSVLYLRFVRRFHLEWDEDSEYPEASGGFFWDGRASSIAALVAEPLLNPEEMNLGGRAALVEKVAARPYSAQLRAEFERVFDTPEDTLEAVGLCLEAFLASREMSPFSSKYDDFIRGASELDAQERRGLALFQDPEKGACSACHRMNASSPLPESSLFSDYGYDTVGVPRNRKLPENSDPSHFDLGVCERHDRKLHTEDDWFCGAFRTPSLRNVALRTNFMHNGVFSSLREVVEFYATRATNPERWYRGARFDDLPARYHEYVNQNTPPYNQIAGEAPRLDASEIDALVAFLGALSDREIPLPP